MSERAKESKNQTYVYKSASDSWIIKDEISLEEKQKQGTHCTPVILPGDFPPSYIGFCRTSGGVTSEGGRFKLGNMQIIFKRFPFLLTQGWQGISVLPLKWSVFNDTLKCYLFSSLIKQPSGRGSISKWSQIGLDFLTRNHPFVCIDTLSSDIDLINRDLN